MAIFVCISRHCGQKWLNGGAIELCRSMFLYVYANTLCVPMVTLNISFTSVLYGRFGQDLGALLDAKSRYQRSDCSAEMISLPSEGTGPFRLQWQQMLFCNLDLHKSPPLRCSVILRAYYACMYEKSGSIRYDLQILGALHTVCLHFLCYSPMVLEHGRVTVCWVPETHVYLVAAKATRVSVRLTPNGSCTTPSSIFIEMTTAPLVLPTHLSHAPRCSNLALSCLLHRSPQAPSMLGLEAFSDTSKIAMTEILVSTCNTERLPTSCCLTTLGNSYSSLSEFRRSESQTKARTPNIWCRNI